MRLSDRRYTFAEWEEKRKGLANFSAHHQRVMRQRHLDFIRGRLIMFGLTNHLKRLWAEYQKDPEVAKVMMSAERPEPYYVWPTTPDLTAYERREGNPPSDSERPAWMRGLDLVIDYNALPKHIWRECAPDGEYGQMVADLQQYEPHVRDDLFVRPVNTIIHPYEVH